MKINRINILIPTAQNKHRKYLYNEMLNLMSRNGFGGEIRNESIKLSAMPENLLKVLEELKINFERK